MAFVTLRPDQLYDPEVVHGELTPPHRQEMDDDGEDEPCAGCGKQRHLVDDTSDSTVVFDDAKNRFVWFCSEACIARGSVHLFKTMEIVVFPDAPSRHAPWCSRAVHWINMTCSELCKC